jgi:AAA-like domain
MNDNSVKTILILEANPQNSERQRLDEEVREIHEGLKRSKQREQFKLEQIWAVHSRDIHRAMLDLQPQIVHFSGRGKGSEGLVFEDEVMDAALAGLFELFADQVECVLLNACYSMSQAEVIAQHIPYVIGMNQAVGNIAASAFAVGFYDALGAGRSIEFAYKLACNSIHMAGLSKRLTPVLLTKSVIENFPILKLSNITDLEDLGGQVSLNSPFYIDRPTNEENCFEKVTQQGALIRVKGSQQMGKSSLILRVLNEATKQGYKATKLNLQAADKNTLEDLDILLKWLCSCISFNIGLPDKVEEYWQVALSGQMKCTRYFESYILKELSTPLVLALDQIEKLFSYKEVAGDFFALLRAWHEESKSTPIWKNLRLVIAYSEIYIPDDIYRSPLFNLGLPISLKSLNSAQIKTLIHHHKLEMSPTEVSELTAFTGGHPYLLRVALYHLAKKEIVIADLFDFSPIVERAYREHLQCHLNNLHKYPKILNLMREVCMANTPINIGTTTAFELSNMGLVNDEKEGVIPLCTLYKQYFGTILEKVNE